MTTLTADEIKALRRADVYQYYDETAGESTLTVDRFIGNLQGNADTATHFATPSVINVTGNASGTISIHGSETQDLNLTVNYATNAGHATNADVATLTNRCSLADLANIANLARNADSATSATHATSADSATHADSADSATSATSANSATNATYDSAGNHIANTLASHLTNITANTTKNTTQDTRLTSLENYTTIKQWNSATTYTSGHIVIYQDNFYRSLQGSNTGHYPTETDSEYWKLLSETAGSGTADCVHLEGAETIIGDKTFSGVIIVPTKEAGDNSTNASSTAYVDSAVSILSNSLSTSISTGTLSVSGNVTVTGSINGNVVGNVTGDVTGNASTATTASKLGSATLGSTTQPIYLHEGTATACNEMLDLTSNQEATGLKYFSRGAFAIVPNDPEDEAIANVLYVKGLFDTLDISVRQEIALATEDFGGVNLLVFVG